MRTIPKFDVSSYIPKYTLDSEQDKAAISKLAGLAAVKPENQSQPISRLATLAVPSQAKQLSDQDIINLLTQACFKTGITPHQFWQFCSDEDMSDIYSNEYTLETLQAFAQSWARYPNVVPTVNSLPFPEIAKEEAVKCRVCKHFLPDTIGDGTGDGKCSIKAPASEYSPLWLNSERYCEKYQRKSAQNLLEK